MPLYKYEYMWTINMYIRELKPEQERVCIGRLAVRRINKHTDRQTDGQRDRQTWREMAAWNAKWKDGYQDWRIIGAASGKLDSFSVFMSFKFLQNINQILTEYINMYGGGCTISDAIGCGTPVSTSLSSVSVRNNKRLSVWIYYIAGFANLCPGDFRLRSAISNAAKLDVISFSKVISRWIWSDRGCIWNVFRTYKSAIKNQFWRRFPS